MMDVVLEEGVEINSKGQLFIYHTLPVITSVFPNIGGDAGSTSESLEVEA